MHTLCSQAADCPPSAVGPTCPGGLSTGIGGFTLGDFGKVFAGPEVHSDGEIWAQTLWDLRTRWSSARAAGASDLAEELVTEAMRISPPEPSFLDMRNSILVADQATAAGLQDLIWEAFAGRGMGFFAGVADSSDVTPIEDFNLPPAPAATARSPGRSPTATPACRSRGSRSASAATRPTRRSRRRLTDTTDTGGRYSFRTARGQLPELALRAGRVRPDSLREGVVAADEDETHNVRCARLGGLERRRRPSRGSDDSGGPFGCGDDQLIDQSIGTAGRRSTPD